MGTILSYLFERDFIEFLLEWPKYVVWIGIAVCCWALVVAHLFKTEHASLKKDGKTDNVVCGDTRVSGLLTIFGGSAGLSFGLPHYWLMDALSMSGMLRDLWSGFVYLQFALSVVQACLLIIYMAIVPRKKLLRFLKAHLGGCGWVSAQSPIGFVLYVLQQRVAEAFWVLRDIETIFVFTFSFVSWPLWAVCVLASIVNTIRSGFRVSILFPTIGGLDMKHSHQTSVV